MKDIRLINQNELSLKIKSILIANEEYITRIYIKMIEFYTLYDLSEEEIRVVEGLVA